MKSQLLKVVESVGSFVLIGVTIAFVGAHIVHSGHMFGLYIVFVIAPGTAASVARRIIK